MNDLALGVVLSTPFSIGAMAFFISGLITRNKSKKA